MEEHSMRNTGSLVELPVDKIKPSALNPRKTMHASTLKELADSIREEGLLQPIIVRKNGDGETYEVIAGERRLAAVRLLKFPTIRAIVDEREITDEKALKLMLIENLQREDLDPIEEAEGFAKLAEMGMKQTEIAEAVKRQQPTVANRLRLLKLPEPVQKQIAKGDLSAGHGVALAKWDAFPEVAEQIGRAASHGKITVHDIEKNVIPYEIPEKLVKEGSAREFDYKTNFDRQECEKCPHGAYRKMNYKTLCLRPECFDAKVAADTAAREAVLARQREELLKEGRPDVVDLDKLARGSFAEVYDDNAPVGCDPECKKRTMGKYNWWVEAREVCLDRPCYDKLQRAAEKQKRAARREEGNKVLELAQAKLSSITEPGGREMVALLNSVMDTYQSSVWGEAFARYNLPHLASHFKDKQTYKAVESSKDWLAEIPPATLCKIVLEVSLQQEVKTGYSNEWSHLAPWARWYLGIENPKEEKGEQTTTATT